MAQFTCHNPCSVYDIIPCDVVGSIVMGAAAALDQVSLRRHYVWYGLSACSKGHSLQQKLEYRVCARHPSCYLMAVQSSPPCWLLERSTLVERGYQRRRGMPEEKT